MYPLQLFTGGTENPRNSIGQEKRSHSMCSEWVQKPPQKIQLWEKCTHSKYLEWGTENPRKNTLQEKRTHSEN